MLAFTALFLAAGFLSVSETPINEAGGSATVTPSTGFFLWLGAMALNACAACAPGASKGPTPRVENEAQ